MGVTLGRQYNVGEKPIVIMYTYINRHAGTPETQQKQEHSINSTYIVKHRSNSLLHTLVGCKDKATTWYLNGFPDGSNLGSSL